jgi:hypothetical protein
MGRLVHTFTGDGRQSGRMIDDHLGQESGTGAVCRTPTGVVIDGVAFPLAGQPPVAVSRGWGNLSFLFFGRR